MALVGGLCSPLVFQTPCMQSATPPTIEYFKMLPVPLPIEYSKSLPIEYAKALPSAVAAGTAVDRVRQVSTIGVAAKGVLVAEIAAVVRLPSPRPSHHRHRRPQPTRMAPI